MELRPKAPGLIKAAVTICLAAFIFLFIPNCSGKKDQNNGPASGVSNGNPLRGGTLTVSNGAEPKTIDPGLVTDNVGMLIVGSLFEGLLIRNPKDLSIQPGIAKSWEVSPDGLVYTFHLRPSVWSDGTPLTAEDFLWSWLRVLRPETASEYVYQLYYIKNARDFFEGKIKDPNEVGIKVLDDLTIQVTLQNPTPFFLGLIAFQTYLPVPRHIIDKYGDKWTTKPEYIVSNGPFIMKEWIMNKDVVVERNPKYWDAGNVMLDKIVFLASDDNVTNLKKFQEGETDWIRTVPLDYIEEMSQRPDYHATPFLSTYFYRFNVTKPPLDNVLVRKALCMSIDKNKLVTFVTKAGEQPADSFVPPGLPGYKGAKGLEFNPGEARKLLAQAGYPGGKGLPVIELKYNTSEGHKAIATAIQAMWKDNLGIEVSLVNEEWKTLQADMRALKYSIARSGWYGDYLDPNTFMDMFVTNGGNNQTGWSNAQYDKLIADAALTEDQNRRFELFRQAEIILVEDEVPIMPIYFYVNKNMLNPRVGGVWFNIIEHHLLKFAYIKADK